MLQIPEPFIAEVWSDDDLIEAFRKIKEIRGLSNEWCDAIGGLTRGHTDKVLGPSRTKNLSPFLRQLFNSLFAVKLIVVIDPDQESRMQARWEARDKSNVRIDGGRVSQKVIDRARPHVLKDLAKAGGAASGAKRTGSQGSEIMRKVARRGWRTRRKNMRQRLAERKAEKMMEVSL